ncbi:hypothetical protein TRAPUB_5364, partial [Trametes pubescens]
MPDPISEATLAPLTALRGVEVMNLDIHCPFDVDNALLERLGAVRPTITHLILGARTPWGIWPGYDIRVGGICKAPDDGDGDGADEAIAPLDTWTKPRATLLGLLAFTRHCPRLAVLGVECNATLAVVPPALLETRPARGAPPHPLDMLIVGLSLIVDPWAVAAVLSDMLPVSLVINESWGYLETEEDAADDLEWPE